MNSESIFKDGRAVMEECQPIYLRYKAGEITESEWKKSFNEIYEKHLGKTEERVEQEWFP